MEYMNVSPAEYNINVPLLLRLEAIGYEWYLFPFVARVDFVAIRRFRALSAYLKRLVLLKALQLFIQRDPESLLLRREIPDNWKLLPATTIFGILDRFCALFKHGNDQIDPWCLLASHVAKIC